jgi:hypothetical protein
MKEDAIDWRAAARAALEANLLGRSADAAFTDVNLAVSLLIPSRGVADSR